MKVLFSIVALFISIQSFSQEANKVYTSDLDNFWEAYDSIQGTTDYSQKIHFINTLYINKGTEGLKAFMKVRKYKDTIWVGAIDKYPTFWKSIRRNTLQVKDKVGEITAAIERLRQLYPELKGADMYFTIGALRSAGTVVKNAVLIGAELATGDPTTDVSAFTDDWLKNVFNAQSADNIVSLNIHEYIHTQQVGEKDRVLHQCIKEGACDFIAELVMGKPLQRKYLSYGRAHAEEILASFKKDMFSDNYSRWMYNGGTQGERADLGYYIGYEICQAYYNQARDKKQAIRAIIQLDYDDNNAVEDFLKQSKFFTDKVYRKLIKDKEKELPYIVKIEPFKNGSTGIDADLKEFKIIFSRAMLPKSYSIRLFEGKEYPIVRVNGFESDEKTFVLQLNLKANTEYGFIITNRSFKSKDGFALKSPSYDIRFTTK